MSKNNTVRLTFEFPSEEHVYLKMMCAKLHMSLKDFATNAIVKKIEDLEDEMDRLSIQEARKDIAKEGTITWNEMEKKLGWDKL